MNTRAQVIEVVTPKRIVLDGLWLGPENPKRALIFIHGLGGNAFSGLGTVRELIDENTAAVTFSNRGHDKVAGLKRLDKRKKKGFRRISGGDAFEVFKESSDDIEGAVRLVESRGVKDIYLMGHSTGSQKAVYYISHLKDQGRLEGVVLSSPMSDYAGIKKMVKMEDLNKVVEVAKKMMAEERGSELLPMKVWKEVISAQRFLSLYTPESEEEIFCYSQKGKIPVALRKIKVRTLVVLGEKDEYRDRPIARIAKWFYDNLDHVPVRIETIKEGGHSFQGKEKEVAGIVRDWLRR